MPPSEDQTNKRGIVSAIVLFAAGFLVAASLLHLVIRNPLYLHADMRSEKLVMLEQLRGAVDSAAFGSSHIHNGFDPRVFDRSMADSSVPLHTVNLAISGGSQSEQRSMALEFVRKLQPPAANHACLVMLELNAGANFTNDHLVHPRSINVYDWQTVRFISRLTSARMSLSQRFGRVGFALAAGLLHYTNIGMLSNGIFVPSVEPEALTVETDDDRRGLHSESPIASAQANLRREVAERTGRPSIDPAELYPGNAELIDELADTSPAHHLSFVYFVYPKLGDLSAEPKYPDHLVTPEGRTVPILNFARPDRYPFLYNPTLWHDDAHLDGAGATVISRLFADQLKTWYATNGAPSACGG